jgi:hypothetical protein
MGSNNHPRVIPRDASRRTRYSDERNVDGILVGSRLRVVGNHTLAMLGTVRGVEGSLLPAQQLPCFWVAPHRQSRNSAFGYERGNVIRCGPAWLIG